MRDVFMAHVEEDADVTLEIALGLEEAGYATWCYEVDSIPGPSYLVQTGKAVEESKVVVLVISPYSLSSRQVSKEVIRAHESGKEFIPILRGITHVEFQNRQPEWREALGATSSIRMPLEGVADILPRIINGLKALAILPGSKAEAAHIAQIRKTLGELRESSMLEQDREPPAPTRKQEPEAIVPEIPLAKTTEEARGQQKRMRLASAPVVIVSQGWFWAGFCSFVLAAIGLAICLLTDFKGTGELIAGLVIFVFPLAVAGGFCLRLGLKKRNS